MSTTPGETPTFDLVVIGCGVAGLAAAVRAAETHPGLSVAVLERTTEQDRGGNSRWTAAYLRLEDAYTVAESFVDDMLAYSGGRSDEAYVRHLAENVPETMDWLQALGVRLRRLPTIFITKARPRLLPVGGGERVVEVLAEEATRLGVTFLYETSATGLLTDGAGAVAGVTVRGPDGRQRQLAARSVLIASGGFEGNLEMLTRYLGPQAIHLRQVSPGGHHNKGEGIRMALDAGAMATGEWGSFHAEPVDPRSSQAEAVVMVFPYGILVNLDGERFVDEGSGTADEIYEAIGRTIWREREGLVYFIGDQRIYTVPGHEHALTTDMPAITADTPEELAALLGLDPAKLRRTIEDFNAAVGDGPYDPTAPDGRSTTGLVPPKSNWAQPLDQLPLVAYPMACAIVFTYGGIATSLSGEVLSADGWPIPGLFAAGECTGLYYGKYPGATSVMRGLVFGRIAGESAARQVRAGLAGAAE